MIELITTELFPSLKIQWKLPSCISKSAWDQGLFLIPFHLFSFLIEMSITCILHYTIVFREQVTCFLISQVHWWERNSTLWWITQSPDYTWVRWFWWGDICVFWTEIWMRFGLCVGLRLCNGLRLWEMWWVEYILYMNGWKSLRDRRQILLSWIMSTPPK